MCNLAKSKTNNKSLWVSDFFTPSVSLLTYSLAFDSILVERGASRACDSCSCFVHIFSHHYFYSWFTVKSIRHHLSSYDGSSGRILGMAKILISMRKLCRLNDGMPKGWEARGMLETSTVGLNESSKCAWMSMWHHNPTPIHTSTWGYLDYFDPLWIELSPTSPIFLIFKFGITGGKHLFFVPYFPPSKNYSPSA